MKRKQLTDFLDQYFGKELIEKAEKIDEKNANGLQIKGAEEVTGAAFGVSANLDFFKQAREKDCNFLVVHHGMRFHDLGLYINKIHKQRLKFLFDNQMSLSGYHFILDHHPEIGNNAQILKKLGAEKIDNFMDEWGWIGRLGKTQSIENIMQKAEDVFGRKPLAEFSAGSKKIKKIAVVSGGAALHSTGEEIKRILNEDIDLYITGEARESTQAMCEEGGINYFAFGHYDTEIFGVKALRKVIQKEFPALKTEFIKIANPL
jgi:dinuclear metal center YbgI/SA1388 family protein